MAHRLTERVRALASSVTSGTSEPASAMDPLVGQTLTIGRTAVLIERVLADGGFARVYVARILSNNKQAALKRVSVGGDPATVKLLKTEIDVMRKLTGHKNIVALYDADIVPGANGTTVANILMELCGGGGCIDQMNTRLTRPYNNREVLLLFFAVCEAVAHMHYQKPPLAHRDLKVENMLFTSEGTLKLCDFGSVTDRAYTTLAPMQLAILEEEVQKLTTMPYRAPELIDLYMRTTINEKVDIWALGVVLYKLMYFKTPFEDTGNLAILNGRYSIPSTPEYAPDLINLISFCLQTDPVRRPNIYQVVSRCATLLKVPCPIENIYGDVPVHEPEPASAATPVRAAVRRVSHVSGPVAEPPPVDESGHAFRRGRAHRAGAASAAVPASQALSSPPLVTPPAVDADPWGGAAPAPVASRGFDDDDAWGGPAPAAAAPLADRFSLQRTPSTNPFEADFFDTNPFGSARLASSSSVSSSGSVDMASVSDRRPSSTGPRPPSPLADDFIAAPAPQAAPVPQMMLDGAAVSGGELDALTSAMSSASMMRTHTGGSTHSAHSAHSVGAARVPRGASRPHDASRSAEWVNKAVDDTRPGAYHRKYIRRVVTELWRTATDDNICAWVFEELAPLLAAHDPVVTLRALQLVHAVLYEGPPKVLVDVRKRVTVIDDVRKHFGPQAAKGANAEKRIILLTGCLFWCLLVSFCVSFCVNWHISCAFFVYFCVFLHQFSSFSLHFPTFFPFIDVPHTRLVVRYAEMLLRKISLHETLDQFEGTWSLDMFFAEFARLPPTRRNIDFVSGSTVRQLLDYVSLVDETGDVAVILLLQPTDVRFWAVLSLLNESFAAYAAILHLMQKLRDLQRDELHTLLSRYKRTRIGGLEFHERASNMLAGAVGGSHAASLHLPALPDGVTDKSVHPYPLSSAPKYLARLEKHGLPVPPVLSSPPFFPGNRLGPFALHEMKTPAAQVESDESSEDEEEE